MLTVGTQGLVSDSGNFLVGTVTAGSLTVQNGGTVTGNGTNTLQIESGSTVTVNGGGGMNPEAPWGGYRESGVGRECGEEGYREYFEVKHVQWPVEPPATR